MNLPGLIGRKTDQKQAFLENGRRIPVTILHIGGNIVCQVKTVDRDGYNAVQLGFGTTKKTNKAKNGHIQKAGLQQMPRFFREIRVDAAIETELGSAIVGTDIFKPGDLINVQGTSKGKGFAGAVKRHHFRGGPRTHGQSDRERAPGSIGQTTTPGRVYKGKRMAGHMGFDTVTVQNLEIIEIAGDTISVKGLVPGPLGSIIEIMKVGESRKHVPFYKKPEPIVEEVAPEVLEEAAAKSEAAVIASADETVEAVQDDKEPEKTEVNAERSDDKKEEAV